MNFEHTPGKPMITEFDPQFPRMQEAVAADKDKLHIGVGEDLLVQTGRPFDHIADLVALWYHAGPGPVGAKRPDGMYPVSFGALPDLDPRKKVQGYLRNIGRIIDVGTRRDMEQLRMGAECDEVDRGRG
jgi:hypothetical protein